MKKSQEASKDEWNTVKRFCPNLGDEVDWYLPVYKCFIHAKVTYHSNNGEAGKYYWWNFIDPITNEKSWYIMSSEHIWRIRKKDENGRIGTETS